MSDTSQRVFLTGASSGFGLDFAKTLAAKGDTVFATMRGIDGKNAAVAAELRDWASAHGHALYVLELDVTNDASIRAAARHAEEIAGGIDVLINNAGIGTFGIQEAFTVEQVQRVYDVNVFGVLRVNRAILPMMRAQGAGHVVYISSGLGRILFPFMGPYSSTKFAIEALAESAHYELQHVGIRTTIIQPGAYGTTFGANMLSPGDPARLETYGPVNAMFAQFAGRFAEMAESGAIGDPQEVTDALVAVVHSSEGPLRVTVGADIQQGVGAINGVAAQVQAAIMGGGEH